MIDSILAAIDTSEFGSRVADHALYVAGVFGSRVRALSVVETRKIEGPLLRDYLATIGLEPGLDYKEKVTRFLETKARALLAEFEKRCAAAGIAFESELVHGIPTRAILERAPQSSLVIVGQKGEHADWHGESIGGSVQDVVRSSPRPILVTPKRYRDVQRAVVAYDGSNHSREALRLATEIARRTQLHVTVLTIQNGSSDPEALRNEIDARIGPSPPAYDLAVRSGEPHREILEFTEQLDCQLVVMGAYGHSRIRELIIGSTTEQVLRRAKVPVLLSR